MENPFLDPKNQISITERIREAFDGKAKGDTFEIPFYGFSCEYVRAALHTAMAPIYKYKTRSAKDKLFVLIVEEK